jgi:VWFA-related protein
MRRLVTGLITTALGVAAVSAQVRRPYSPAEVPPTPQFKSSVDVVHLDVSVLDEQRRPVRGLKPSDFTILEDGQPRDIAVFEAVEVPDPEPATATWKREVARDVRANDDVQERRLFLLVLDDSTIQASPRAINTAKDVARMVIDRFGTSDLAAVIFTRDNRHAQDFTTDRTRLLTAVNKFTVGFRDMGLRDAEAQQPLAGQDDGYFLASSTSLERAVNVLTSLPDRRKSIVYIGQGVPANLESTGFAPPGLPPSGGMSIQMAQAVNSRIKTQMERIFMDARRANINVYTIDACGLRVPGEGSAANVMLCVPGVEQEYLRIIASNTGGRAIVDTNDFTAGVEAIFMENASYYLLGIHPASARPDGKLRRLEVKVNRPGVTVRTRNGYREEKASDVVKRKEALANFPAGVALAGILPKSDLPLQVSAVPFAVPGKKESAVAVTVGVRQPIRRNADRTIERVDLLVSAFDVYGKALGSKRLTANVTLRAGASGLAEYEVLSRIDLKPGRYQLRIGASVGSLSTQGSVYYDIDVPDFSSAPVSMSGLVLTASGGGEVAPKDALTSVMPVIPTTRRTFAAEQQVSAFMRLYQGGKGTLVAVPLRVQLIDASDKLVMDRRQDITAPQFTKDRAANILIPVQVDRLAAGEYLLRIASATSDAIRREARIRVVR